jgi:N-acetylglucosaminyldiphosphoundecaprenol N-acetyl-beta-D-mannosaminyltransferase
MAPKSAPPRPNPGARFPVLDVQVDALDLSATADRIEEWIASGRRSYVCHANVHAVMEAHRAPHVRAVYAGAGLNVADGMPLVWLGRQAGHAAVGRVYGPDLMLELSARAARRGYSAFYLGGAPGVAEALAAATHRGSLEASALIGVGAAFDFHTRRKRQAPRVMQRMGLEWLFRLAVEPARLWHRYLVYNPWFVALVAAERLGLRGQAVDPARPASPSQASTTAAAPQAHNDRDQPGGR